VKADLTRKSFDPLKHFAQVLMQQGRVQLDADWNEQAGIVLHLLRRLAADQFGPAFRPRLGGGFGVLPLVSTTHPTGLTLDFGIQPGSFYVDGILCELEATPVRVITVSANNEITVAEWTIDGGSFAVNQYVRLWNDSSNPGVIPAFQSPFQVSQITGTDYQNKTLTLDGIPSGLTPNYVQRIITFRTQPDLPQPAQGQSLPPPLVAGSYLVYLDVWERLITYIEDDSIREVALNGPDTAARARVVWQVKALPHQPLACIPQAQLSGMLQPWTRGLLRARVQPAQASTDPCTISPDSRYRGAENQLYRIEIHTGNLDPSGKPITGASPSFKWSRDDGSTTYPIVRPPVSGTASTTVTLGSLGRDDRYGVAVGDYVEVQDDYSVLNNIPGNLLQVQSINRTNLTVVLGGVTTAGVGADQKLHPLLRRWDHKSGDPAQGGAQVLPDGALPITGGTWLDLEDGVQVWFELLPNVAPAYRSADYWLIPARVATGDVIWPADTWTDSQGNTVTGPAAKPPDGITHHYVSLALVTFGENGTVSEATPCLEFPPT
jgi:hypothetical protein